ncbi:hypothetical protein A1O7_01414 [Cladophialophora yegresii CBS 114405]|uniref:Uncharacterized protein n=1 Tax=Cladophialophora yegresii CBS 114405 TaxID=1182544 RepID=W9X3K6_9EURO|nr:uncharacterized protein A1O7_01414 [Cladophialophora yegresii CBS 114405]EXJ65074.1 hypothetical protein A1O7_01414 [Cladophialophora yegresii CBS 114405]
MIPQPAPLAATVLGQQVQEVARHARNELLAPLNGIDYRHHRPPVGMHADEVTRRLWTLHTRRDANEVISHIIRVNIEVLHHVGAQLDKLYQALKRQAAALVHHSTQPSSDGVSLEGEVARLRTAMEEHERWVQVLRLEVQLSEVALLRMEAARRLISLADRRARGEITPFEMYQLEGSPFHTYQAARAEVVRLVRRVYEMTGNAAFLERHKNELWDVVAQQVE